MTKVCWQRDGAWQVGERAQIKVSLNPRVVLAAERINRIQGVCLIKHWPTGELELVDANLLRPYPMQEIAQP